MNILISSAMLAVAILMVANSIYELRPRGANTQKRPSGSKKRTRTLRTRKAADWDRIMEETQLRSYKAPEEAEKHDKKN